MIGFEYYNPAKIVFGGESEKSLTKLLAQNKVKSLLLVYSGDFIKTLGIYDEIEKAVKELGIDDKDFEVMAKRATRNGTVGHYEPLDAAAFVEILKLAL